MPIRLAADTFLTPEGRMGQRVFWIAILSIGVLSLLLQALTPSSLRLAGNLLQLGFLYPAYCVLAQRFHDIGRTAWLAAAPMLVLGLSLLISTAGFGFVAPSEGAAAVMLMVGGLIMLMGVIALAIFVLWAGTARGDAHANAYGPAREETPAPVGESEATPPVP